MKKFIAGMKRVFQSFLPGKRPQPPDLGLPDIDARNANRDLLLRLLASEISLGLAFADIARTEYKSANFADADDAYAKADKSYSRAIRLIAETRPADRESFWDPFQELRKRLEELRALRENPLQ
jgi:hypothetical protein